MLVLGKFINMLTDLFKLLIILLIRSGAQHVCHMRHCLVGTCRIISFWDIPYDVACVQEDQELECKYYIRWSIHDRASRAIFWWEMGSHSGAIEWLASSRGWRWTQICTVSSAFLTTLLLPLFFLLWFLTNVFIESERKSWNVEKYLDQTR